MKKDDIRQRLLRIIRMILEYPYGYNKQQISTLCNVSIDTVERDLVAIENAGFTIYKDDKRQYAFAGEKPLEQLKELIYFTEEEQNLLQLVVDRYAPYIQRVQAEKLKRKVTMIYDYRRLGYAHLRRPYLDKIDLLKKALKERRQVFLINYHSSHSNVVSNRLVECFLVLPSEDIIQAFDIDKNELRHFRLSRIGRIQLSSRKWQFESMHRPQKTDPFRIVDDLQVWVHLRLKVGGYNELVERFPATAPYTLPAADQPDVYDFQCEVNHKFLGLSNFILGSYHQIVEIVEPESLLDHLRKTIGKMNF